MKDRSIFCIYGAIWIAVGFMLLSKGLGFLANLHLATGSLPLASLFMPGWGGPTEVGILFVALGLILGMLKGRTVLAKASQRNIDRILEMGGPVPLLQIFGLRFYIIIGVMMGIGFALRLLNAPADIHGIVDVAVGAGLIQASFVYFRKALNTTTVKA